MFNPKEKAKSVEFWLGSDKRFGLAQDYDAGTDHIYMFTAQGGLQHIGLVFLEEVRGIAQ